MRGTRKGPWPVRAERGQVKRLVRHRFPPTEARHALNVGAHCKLMPAATPVRAKVAQQARVSSRLPRTVEVGGPTSPINSGGIDAATDSDGCIGCNGSKLYQLHLFLQKCHRSGGYRSCSSAGSSRSTSPGCKSAEPATTSITAWLLRGPSASRQGRRFRRTARTEPIAVQENDIDWKTHETRVDRVARAPAAGRHRKAAGGGIAARPAGTRNHRQSSTGQPRSCRSSCSPNAKCLPCTRSSSPG